MSSIGVGRVSYRLPDFEILPTDLCILVVSWYCGAGVGVTTGGYVGVQQWTLV